MLLVVAHPSVGGGIEALLRIEGRYDLRRVLRLDDATVIAKTWPADLALVDGAMLAGEIHVEFGAPTLVLSGSEAEGARLARALDDCRGTLRKDAAAAELVAGVESVIGRGPIGRGSTQAAGSLALVTLAVLIVALVTLLLYLAYVALV